MEIIHAPKLWWIVLSLCTALLLSSLENTIVSTALVSIGSSFQEYGESNWVVIAYLLTYSSFLVIHARLSDITGRKPTLLISLAIFTAASLACGLAKTLTQLIVFRSIQGIGGSGIYALTMVLVSEITPKKHFGPVSAMVNVVFVAASAVGPTIGGAITTYSTWRWCFWLNVPSGAVVLVVTWFLFPEVEGTSRISFRESVRRVDWLGLLLVLGASIVIILPLHEAGSQWAWNSVSTIVMIVIGGICWAAFASWEVWLSRKRDGEAVLMPMLPKHVVLQRVMGSCMLTSFLTGLAFSSVVVYLPQRFQAVDDFSPVKAGVNILPVLVVSALAATASGFVLGKKNICSYILIVGNALQLVGLGLTSAMSTEAKVPTSGYGYQAILGLGLWSALASYFTLVRIECRRQDIAPTVGAITQLRIFGGVIGVVICRVAQTSYLRYHLAHLLSSSKIEMVLSSVASIRDFPADQAAAVREVYRSAFNWQWRILTFIAAANVVVGLFSWRRHPKALQDPNTAAIDETEVTANRTGVVEGDLEMDGQKNLSCRAAKSG